MPSPGNIFLLFADLLISGAYLHASNLLQGSLTGLETSIFLLEDILFEDSNKRTPPDRVARARAQKLWREI